MFGRRKERAVLAQSSPEEWRRQWQSLVPPECRDVPVTVGERTEVAFVQENHFAMMLQDGLLMEPSFFDVCEHFQRAGYHVIWLMRCTQDIENGYLRRRKALRDGGFLWDWRSPTTNFGRWTSDNRYVTILLQHRPPPVALQDDVRSLPRLRYAPGPRELALRRVHDQRGLRKPPLTGSSGAVFHFAGWGVSFRSWRLW